MEIYPCDKATLRLNRKKHFYSCLEFGICPGCGDDLEHRNWTGSGGAYDDHLYCSECDKVFYRKE